MNNKNQSDKYIYNFIINNKCIEYTEPIEELIRERNTTVKYGEKTMFPYFWCYSLDNFSVTLQEKQQLNGIFANQRIKLKNLDKNFIVVSTNDINLRDWLKIKLPDFLDLGKGVFYTNYSENLTTNYFLDNIDNYNGFITTLENKKEIELTNNLYEEIYSKNS